MFYLNICMEKYIQKHCKQHGETEFVLEGRRYYRCKKCRVQGVYKRRKKVRDKLIEYKGGKCSSCGYNKCFDALEFHHLNDKTFQLNLSTMRGWKNSKVEADKCELLCANCHRERHSIANSTAVVAFP